MEEAERVVVVLVGGEGAVAVVAVMVGGEGAVAVVVVVVGGEVVVETTAGGEERDSGSPGAVIVTVVKKLKNMTDSNNIIHHLPILRLIMGAELAILLRECELLNSVGKPQTLGSILIMPIAYCDCMSSLGRSSL